MFVPLHNFVTVVLDPKTEKTPGGLVMPDNFGDVFITGVIRAVGPGHRLENGEMNPPSVCRGDRVMLAQHTQQTPRGTRTLEYPTLTDDGVKCILCDHTDIVGVIREAPLALA